jgi:hypothetical protein
MEMLEEWRPVRGFEGLYSVSNMGRVRSESRVIAHKHTGTRRIASRILRPGLCGPKGHPQGQYRHVLLSKNDIQTHRSVHSLVAEAFLGYVVGRDVVKFCNDNRADNSLGNLYVVERDAFRYVAKRRKVTI